MWKMLLGHTYVYSDKYLLKMKGSIYFNTIQPDLHRYVDQNENVIGNIYIMFSMCKIKKGREAEKLLT